MKKKLLNDVTKFFIYLLFFTCVSVSDTFSVIDAKVIDMLNNMYVRESLKNDG